MPETSDGETGKSDLVDALGPHFGKKVTEHLKKHEQTTVRADREKKLNDLSERLKHIAGAEGLRDKDTTEAYDVQTLDTGTKVAAFLHSGDGSGVAPTAGSLTDLEAAGKHYMDQGSYSDALAGCRFIENDIVHQEAPYGLRVSALLETPRGEAKTEDAVFVGAILDPESIMVPEVGDTDDNAREHFSIIGPNDPRFNAIMTMADQVADGVGSWGEKPHVG